MGMLRAGEVDLAVGSMIHGPAKATYTPPFTYDPVRVTAHDHPLARAPAPTLAAIARHGVILPPRHLSTWHVVDLVFQQHRLEYRVVLKAGGWEVIKRLVELGPGIAIVSGLCLRGDEALATLPIGHWFPRRTDGAVVRTGRVLSVQAQAFLGLLDPEFRARPATTGATGPAEGRGAAHAPDFSGFDRSLA